MKTIYVAAILAISAFAASQAQAQIVNIDGTNSIGTTVNLAAGTYDVTFAGIPGGGQYNGFSLYMNNGVPSQYTDELAITMGGQTNFNTSAVYNLMVGNTQQQQTFATASDALAAYQTALAAGQISYSANYTNQNYISLVNEITFTLNTAGQVTFTAPDVYYPDATGGLSILLSQVDVPEPASIALMATGLFGLTLMMRRRGKGGTNHSVIAPIA